MEDILKVGIITKTHGIKGQVKVFPTTDDPERFLDLDYVLLNTGFEYKTLHINSVNFFKNQVILGFKEINNINEIEKYRGKDLWIYKKDAVPLDEDEYYIGDLIGLKVVTDEGKDLGILDDVLETGANDVYIVKDNEGKELLLPAIKECILDVDLDEEVMIVHIMKGLL